jgi:hypothetical protein
MPAEDGSLDVRAMTRPMIHRPTTQKAACSVAANDLNKV